MAKSKRKKKQVAVAEPTKRDTLKLMRNGAIAAVVLGGAGYLGVRRVQADLAEQDLSLIGNGKPTLVQIHDPQCPVCNALQKEARAALSNFEECTIQYVVANIRTDQGATLAGNLGVPHVTLVLYDAGGEVQEILRGPNDEAAILAAFESAYGVRPSV